MLDAIDIAVLRVAIRRARKLGNAQAQFRALSEIRMLLGTEGENFSDSRIRAAFDNLLRTVLALPILPNGDRRCRPVGMRRCAILQDIGEAYGVVSATFGAEFYERFVVDDLSGAGLDETLESAETIRGAA